MFALLQAPDDLVDPTRPAVEECASAVETPIADYEQQLAEKETELAETRALNDRLIEIIKGQSQAIQDLRRQVTDLQAQIADLQRQLEECCAPDTPGGEVYLFRHNCGFDDEAIAYAEQQGCTICPPFFYWGALLNDRRDQQPSREKIKQWCDWHVPEGYDGPLVLDMENIPRGQQWFDRLRAHDKAAEAFFISLIDTVLQYRPKAKITFWGMPPLRHGWDKGFWGVVPEDWRKDRREEAFWCTDLYDRFGWFLPEWYTYHKDPPSENGRLWEAFFVELSRLTRDIAGDRPVIVCLWTRCGEGPFRDPALFTRDSLMPASRLVEEGVIDGVAIWSDPKMGFERTKPYIDAAVNAIIKPHHAADGPELKKND
jgi:hypothetical protein